MGVELLRVDDRLVHGQVVEGWVKALRINRIKTDNFSVKAATIDLGKAVKQAEEKEAA